MSSELAILSNFYKKPWYRLYSNLNEDAKYEILNNTGMALHANGRSREAIKPLVLSLNGYIHRKYWKYASISAGNLSELYLLLGNIKQAIVYGKKSAKFAYKGDDSYEKCVMRTILAKALHQSGKISKAFILFQSAEKSQKAKYPKYEYLFSCFGFDFSDLLLSQGKSKEVQIRLKKILKIDKKRKSRSLLDSSLNMLSLGNAYFFQNQKERDKCQLNTINYFIEAVNFSRKAAMRHYIPRGLLSRAALYRYKGEFHKAWLDLTEAQEIAEWGGMKLYLTDYHLEASRIISNQLSVDSYQLIEDSRVVRLSREKMISRLKMHIEKAALLTKYSFLLTFTLLFIKFTPKQE